MPYTIQKRDGKFCVVNQETQKVKGTHDSREKAIRQMKLLQGIEHGWEPSKKS